MKKPLLLGIILTACIVIVTFVFAQFYPEGMISYWKFDEGSGLTASDSVDGNHGTIYGATWTTGQVGGALSFNGVDDYVEIPDDNSLDIIGDLTLEAWIEPDRVYYTAQGEIIGKWVAGDASYWFAIRDGQLQMRISATGSDYYNIEETSDANLIIDTWYHVVGVYDASEQDIKLYINGVEESTTVEGIIPPIIHSGSENVKIGGFYPGYYFDGIIDEVAIYNRVLSLAEIQQHYQDVNYEVECAPSGMVSWWDGDAISGTIALDIQDGNDGRMVGGVSTVPGMVGDAFTFTGTGADYVRVPNDTSLEPASVTVDAWVRAGSPGRYRYIVAKGVDNCKAASYALYTGSDEGLYFYVFDGSSTFKRSPNAGAEIWDNQWHHVAGTYDGSAVRLFVDGVEVGSGTQSAISIGYGLPTHNDLIIGDCLPTCWLLYPGAFRGDIDEVEIFNRALPQSEIQAIYDAGSAGKCKELVNQPPVAVCEDIEIPIVENCQSRIITPEDVDGGSNDPDGDSITLSIDNIGPFTTLDEHYVNLTVTDDSGESDTCLATVTVVDRTPPEISISVSPDTLRPPNHKMVLIDLDITASDTCDFADPTVVLTSITMNEGEETNTYDPLYDSTLGDGHTTDDMQVINGEIWLRAERSGKGDGRIYTITYTATDASGNITTAIATVTVPHDKR